ncbi:MAG: hypothetical protein ACOC6C_01960 [Verrucomicrobiota bacterium]
MNLNSAVARFDACLRARAGKYLHLPVRALPAAPRHAAQAWRTQTGGLRALAIVTMPKPL